MSSHGPAPDTTSDKPTLSYATPILGKYTVGTLVYTTGGLVAVFFWLLLGDFALSMRERSVNPVFSLLLKDFKASDTYVSLLLQVLPPAISLTLGPIIAFRSDRHRGKWGRRIPYLLIPTPIAAASMIGLAACPQIGTFVHELLGASSPGLNTVVLVLFGIMWTLFEVAAITGTALLGALVNDVVPRNLLGRFFGLFRAVSLTAGMLFNYYLIKWSQTHYFELFLVIGIIFGVGFALMCFMVKEGEYPPPAPISAAGRVNPFAAAASVYLKECFTQPYYLWVFLAMLLAALTFAPFNLFSIFYREQVGMTVERYGELVAMSYLISLILAYPLGWLVDKYHSMRVGLVTLVMYAASVTYGWLLVRDEVTFGIALVLHTVLSGSFFTASASLGQALFPKLKFGQFSSAAGITNSLSSIGLGLALGPILDYSGNNYRLTFLIGLILCGSAVFAMIVVYRYFIRFGGPKGYVAPDNEMAEPTQRGFEVIPK